MKKIPLLPGPFRWIGWVLFVGGVSLYAYDSIIENDNRGFFMNMFVLINDSPLQKTEILKIMEVDVFLSVLLLILLVGLSFVAFARQRVEDEMINSLRLYSWSWSVILMILTGIVATIFVYGLSFVTFALFFGHVLLMFYIVIFHYNLYRMNRRKAHEE